MQFKLNFNKLRRIYIFFLSLSLSIIIFSTTFLHASSFSVTNIEISESFNVKAQVVGHVEAAPTKELLIQTAMGSFEYH